MFFGIDEKIFITAAATILAALVASCISLVISILNNHRSKKNEQNKLDHEIALKRYELLNAVYIKLLNDPGFEGNKILMKEVDASDAFHMIYEYGERISVIYISIRPLLPPSSIKRLTDEIDLLQFQMKDFTKTTGTDQPANQSVNVTDELMFSWAMRAKCAVPLLISIIEEEIRKIFHVK